MAIRKRALPRGWYPDEPESLRELVVSWVEGKGKSAGLSSNGDALAAVAPHAGWAFSGRIAALSVAALANSISGAVGSRSTLAIFGGHLPPGAQALAAPESEFDTPLGGLDADLELLKAFDDRLRSCPAGAPPRAGHGQRVGLGVDEEPDNTVEVLLPLIAVLMPSVRVLWLRTPNDESSIKLGEALYAAAQDLGRKTLCLGSSDLTHYGPNYGFSPMGRGSAAEAWVRGTNDKRFIDALLGLDPARALALGETERSACSSGAAAAALAFALSGGASRARLLKYATSLEFRPDDSFVGYASVAFYR
jgi:AmmeMemoRadiSam system protein B